MRQKISSVHYNDKDGNPAGGQTEATGIVIKWQDGPLMIDGLRREPTGAFVEGVIEAAADRIRYYQQSDFACEENAAALDHLEQAMDNLESRTKRRTDQGVEGTHEGN